ncbi:hypothetical protein IQ62_42195 [Streptomyces scabiei]|nr:hypothetical protein IQ62_42195 [Streptomyces scabiei]
MTVLDKPVEPERSDGPAEAGKAAGAEAGKAAGAEAGRATGETAGTCAARPPAPARRRAPFSSPSVSSSPSSSEEALLSEVYRQPVEVFPHPRTGDVLITPKRGL